MLDWTIVVPAFLTAAVEWVEAFTIVLAVSLSIGWRAASGAALAALTVLAAMTAITGGVLGLGVRWLAKAVARGAGLKALHDEALEFADTRALIARGDWMVSWLIAFKGVLLEGLEVWLVVVAFGLHGRAWVSSSAGALAALLAVVAAGLMVQAPLRNVPENAIKFAVGAMITAFGSFWTLEAVGGAAAWPWGDWSLLGLAAFYALGGLALVALLRQRSTAGAAR